MIRSAASIVYSVLFTFTANAQNVPSASLTTQEGTAVSDAKGHLVGYLVQENFVQQKVGNQWISFVMNAEGIPDDSIDLGYYYASADCTGVPYMSAHFIPTRGTISHGKLYFPAIPFATFTAKSFKNINGCTPFGSNPQVILAGRATSIALPNFVPPFTAH